MNAGKCPKAISKKLVQEKEEQMPLYVTSKLRQGIDLKKLGIPEGKEYDHYRFGISNHLVRNKGGFKL